MRLLDQVLGRFTSQPSGGQRRNALLDLATALIQGHPGGLAGLVQQFTDAGLGREANSWVGTGQNLPLSAEQLSQVFGQGTVGALGEQFNLSSESASAGLASLLPALIDHLTPNGQVDSETPLTASLSRLRGRFNV